MRKLWVMSKRRDEPITAILSKIRKSVAPSDLYLWLSRFRAYGFLASAARLIEAGHRLGKALTMLPFFDGNAAESPRAADPKAGNETASQQAIDGSGMDSEVFGKFGDSENLFIGGHSFIFLSPPGKSLCGVILNLVIIIVFVAGADVKQPARTVFTTARALHTGTCI
jgi:hypothetical protein